LQFRALMKATSFLLKVAVFATLWLLMKLVDRL
jgi:hypothetical protein